MSNRIRQLEDALAILQATVSDRPHPLLTEDHLKVKFGAEALNPKYSEESDEEVNTQASIDALGTLTLGEAGESRYFGRSAGSEVRRDPSFPSNTTPHGPFADVNDGMRPVYLRNTRLNQDRHARPEKTPLRTGRLL